MKIVLVYPNQTELDDLIERYRFLPGHRPKPQIPLGILYLCSNLKHEVAFIDNNIKRYSNEKLFSEITKNEPDIVGFGGTMMEWLQASKVSKMLQQVNIPTVYGGPNATANSEKHINYFDYIIRGEGEVTLNELLDVLENGGNLNVKGLWFKIGSKIIKNPDRDFLKDLDVLKYPARDIVNINDYDRSSSPFMDLGPSDIVISTRGCPYSCRFCSSKYFWKQTYRSRRVEEVIKEIKFMAKNYNTKTVHFREDIFTVNKKRVIEFCKQLKNIGMHWICQSRVDHVDEQLVKRMKESGCIGICFGFESFNNCTLKYLQKRTTLEQSIRAIDICERVGINWSGGFMVGVLNETEKDMHKTLTFVKKVRKYPHSRLPPGAQRFLGFPVSETYFEMIDKHLVDYNWQNGELLIPRTKFISARRVEKILYRDRMSYMDGPTKIKNIIWRNFKKILSKNAQMFIKNFYLKLHGKN